MHFSILPTLLIVTSVSAVSLSDISPLPSGSVTPGCESAYSEQISACPSDLRTSKLCSAECSSALDETAKEVIAACRQAFVGPDSLLRRVLDGGIQKALCGAAASSSVSSTTCLTDSTSVATATTITPTASPSASTLASTLTTSLIKSAATTTRAPSFSGAMTFSTVQRLAGSSGLPEMLTLDNSPVPTDSFDTPDPSVTQILYNTNSTSTTESSRIATASATPSSGNGNGNGSPFAASGTNSAPSSSVNVQRSAWAAFALLTAFLSL
ncbi:hypothetical protein B9Z19DRAFT_977593 [Tuber borchii]|uniref:Extracellular membrane protein CFEM domain-containing protein n=1 Tax=Tuber borchii TaxID=42251 RepID=A0A2T6ZWG4_TUBBO|nr:hypothetical protein B9Z19DRAFT_977593 [Tuber borchii]